MKTRLHLLNVLFALLMFGALSACSDDDTVEPTSPPVIPPDEETVILSSNDPNVQIEGNGTIANITFDPVSGSSNVIVTSTLKWYYEEPKEDWLTVEKVGMGIKISVDRYDLNIDRSYTIDVSTDDPEISATINITQKASDGGANLYIEKYAVEIPDNGGSIDLSVITNQSSWDFEIIEGADWLTAEKNAEGDRIVLSAGENDQADEKIAIVKVRGVNGDQVAVEKDLKVTLWSHSLVLIFNTNNPGESITLPIAGKINVKVLWEDDDMIIPYEKTVYGTGGLLSHSYDESGVHEVRINGDIQRLAYAFPLQDGKLDEVERTVSERLKVVAQWGKNGVTNMDYAFSKTGIGGLPEDPFGVLSDVTSCYAMFVGCTSLFELEKGVFDHMTNLTDISSMFASSVITNVGEDLFANNPNIQTVKNLFYNCGYIKTVPEKLFANNTKIEDATSLFSNCINLNSVPENLLANNTAIKTAASMFYKCESLKTIPAKVFANNTAIVNFNHLFADSGLETVPVGLFANNSKVQTMNNAFEDCPLTTIPEDLFAGCPELKDLYLTFWGSSLTKIPANLFANNKKIERLESTFNRTKITEIPTGLLKNCSNLVKTQSMFYGCEELITIPADLFVGCSSLQDINQMFARCPKLKEIPAGLFDNTPTIQNLGLIFGYCAALTTIPEKLFDGAVNATNFNQAFSGCESLTALPKGLFAKNTKVTNFSNAFTGCTSLVTIPEDLFNAPEITGTTLTGLFKDCSKLTAIPEKLFVTMTNATSFANVFENCTSLVTIPATLFDNNKKVTSFSSAFSGCTNLTGESPFTMVDTNKVHLYERNNNTSVFSRVTSSSGCFRGCTGLSDYSQIPSGWR